MPKILQYPNNVLTTPCEPVTDFADAVRVGQELIETMKNHPRASFGLAANQIGHSLRVFALNKQHLRGDFPKVFVNPEIIAQGTLQESHEEGCMSFPASVTVSVVRPVRVTIMAFKMNGEEFTVELDGMASRCAQHEIDHLLGLTLVSHMTKPQRKKALQNICAHIKRKK